MTIAKKKKKKSYLLIEAIHVKGEGMEGHEM